MFLFLSIGLVMLGGSVYRHIMTASGENNEIRTTFSYIANQVRRADTSGSIEIGPAGNPETGPPALMLNQDFDGIACVTYLYYWEGSLRELFVEKGVELDPGAGLAVIALEGLTFEEKGDGLISVMAYFQGGESAEMLLSPRSDAKEAGR